ncbi:MULTISPECIES: hypothetical protein [Parachlamydia]|jgi:hypothetical protein|uniref:hypothetical protein n=1 Tax=Parachlamydia TaxID=83551 RepID=UPI0001C17428|nr:hypothetical protein [Parachlamydia acanthamoebae]EFB40959.1 hypothetical protein pah_c173o005 [Parachlamydia acanthamoebae str. Hall's coccus]
MKIVVDNQIVKFLAHDTAKIVKDPFLSSSGNYIHFGWSSLLEYLELGSIFSSLPVFDQTQPVFKACISVLFGNEAKEILYMYDRLFAENLSQIQDLPSIKAAFLLQKMQEQRQKSSFPEVEKLLLPTLASYEVALRENTSRTMRDLILYLAWDRMCVCMAHLFDHQSTDPNCIQGMQVLKECLIESYQHIAQQGQTVPGIYRMIESLFFYEMRDENLQKHTSAEWSTLNHSFRALKAQDALMDFFYIDDAIIAQENLHTEEEAFTYYLTLDSADKVNARLALAQCIMNKLNSEFPSWGYVLRPINPEFLHIVS